MSHDVLRSGEFAAIALCILIVLVAAAVAAFVVRNRALGRGHTAYLVAVHNGARFRLGQAQVSPDSVRWFGMRSLSMRPALEWPRGELELGPPRPAKGSYAPVLSDPVRVAARTGGRDLEILMNSVDYTALRSWSESAPPGIHADVA